MASEKNCKNEEIYTIQTSESLPKKKDGVRKFWHIDKEMLRFKVHYFLFIGAFGACSPYIPIFAQERVGISPSAFSAFITTQRCIFIFSKPAMGYISDYFNKLKLIICSLSVIMTVFFFALLAVPKIEKGSEKSTLDGNISHYELLNTSEARVFCDLYQTTNFHSIEILHSNSSNNDNFCFQVRQQVLSFFSQCSQNENGDNRTELSVVLEHNINAMYSLASVHVCKACCRRTKECQSFNFKNSRVLPEKSSIEKRPISDFGSYQFWCFALLATISMTCGNSLFTLTDTACCESVQRTGSQFGRQRLWGAIGWGLMSPVGGLLNDYTGDFLAAWILMAILSFLSLLNMSKLEMRKPKFAKNLMKDIKTVLSSKEVLAFMFCVVMNGIGIGIMWFYLVLFLTDIGGCRFLCGMVMFVQCFFGEIPFMFFAGWANKKIGQFNVLTLSLAAYSIRFFWYSNLHNPWLVLPTEILHGFTYGLFFTNMASFAKLSSKPGTEATTQALMSTAHEGIGVGIGSVAAGLCFDTVGGHKTFLYASIYAACTMVLSVILHLFVRKQKRSINVTPPTNT